MLPTAPRLASPLLGSSPMRATLLLFALLVPIAQTALADVPTAANSSDASSSEEADSNGAHEAPYNPVGLGVLTQSNAGVFGVDGVVEGINHFRQTYTNLGVRQYGYGQSRLEMGSDIGVELTAISGVTLVGLHGWEKFSPHIGIEPMSGRIIWSTNSDRQSYYEWMPALSLGLQSAWGSCRALPLVRAGGGLGNFAQGNFKPRGSYTYGAGFYLNCAKVDLAAENTWLANSGRAASIGAFDASMAVLPSKLRLGVRGETLLGQNPHVPGTFDERRLMLLIRGDFGAAGGG